MEFENPFPPSPQLHSCQKGLQDIVKDMNTIICGQNGVFIVVVYRKIGALIPSKTFIA